MGRHATFSPEQAIAILRDPRPVAEIAVAYGVSAPLIYKVKGGDAISTASTPAEVKYFKEWNRIEAEKYEAKATKIAASAAAAVQEAKAQAQKHRDFLLELEAEWPSGQG